MSWCPPLQSSGIRSHADGRLSIPSLCSVASFSGPLPRNSAQASSLRLCPSGLPWGAIRVLKEDASETLFQLCTEERSYLFRDMRHAGELCPGTPRKAVRKPMGAPFLHTTNHIVYISSWMGPRQPYGHLRKSRTLHKHLHLRIPLRGRLHPLEFDVCIIPRCTLLSERRFEAPV